jgi:RHS repeat-associated protein
MKNIILILLFLPLVMHGQNPSKNFVKTKVYNKPSTGVITAADTLVSVDYYDGHGRLEQSVAVKAGGTGKDIIRPVVYDERGRQVKNYLPYVDVLQTGSTANYRDNNQIINNLDIYYQNKYPGELSGTTPNPYSEIKFDESPLARITQKAAPGSDWSMATSDHTVKYEYDTNSRSSRTVEGDNVYNFTVGYTDGNTQLPNIIINGYYNPGMLTKLIIKNENWIDTDGNNNTTHEFRDKQGRLILKRNFEAGVNQDTYYVYDKFNNLTFVIPPKASIVRGRINLNGSTDYSIISESYNGLVYKYRYDSRKRVVEKFTPDKGWEYIVYDKLSRPVLTQDQNQFNQPTGSKKWLFIKYDAFNRPVYSGEYTTDASRLSLQESVNASTVFSETRQAISFSNGGAAINYTNGAFPTANINVFSVNYYDTYSNFDKDGITVPLQTTYATPVTTFTKSLKTGSKVRAVGSNLWETKVTFYDTKGRTVWLHSQNRYQSSENVLQVLPDFNGHTLKSKTTHSKTGQTTISVEDIFTYDAPGRLLKHTQKINSGSENLIAFNDYDELGKLKAKKVGGTASATYNSTTAWQAIDYGYNVRGWLKSINDIEQDLSAANSDLFAFKINYNTKDKISSTQLYNGNIAETRWKSKTDNKIRNYSYQYDALDRLKSANYLEGYTLSDNPAVTEDYSENVTYDKNGNILRLQRKGYSNANITTIDNLTYAYETNSNRLKKITDTYTGINAATDGFIDGANIATEYTYDGNGNMTSDANKGITSITYNHLSQPLRVTFTGTNKYIDYVYDFGGSKLKKVVKNGFFTTTTQYIDGFVYQETEALPNNLQYFSINGGYVAKNGSTYNYVFQYNDNLGNVRASYTKDTSGIIKIVEENNYYAFGMKHVGYNSFPSTLGNGTAQKLKFNGIEYEDGLNYKSYEMDFRHYDPSLARWMVVDPITHYNQSPYTAFNNNPVTFADPEGLAGIQTNYGNDSWGRPRFDKNGIYIAPNARGRARTFSMVNLMTGGDGYGGINNGLLSQYYKSGPFGNIYAYTYTYGIINSDIDGSYGDSGSEITRERVEISNQTGDVLSNINSTATMVEAIGTALEMTKKAGPYIKGMASMAGYTGDALGLYMALRDYRNGTISGPRAGYRATGVATGAVLGGAIGGPEGAAFGLVSGLMFDASEYAYDIIAPQVQGSMNGFYNSLTSQISHFH